MNLLKTDIDLSCLRSVALADKEMVEAIRCKRMCESCENSFATLFMWAAAYDTKIMKWRDMLLVYNPANKVLHFPWGREATPEELLEIYTAFNAAGLLKADFIYNIPPGYQERYPSAAQYFDFKAELADADYIYPVEKLINLTGSKLRKKRNHIKRFELAYPANRVEALTPQNLPQAYAFMRKMDEGKNLATEEAAIKRGVENFEALGLGGLVLYADTNEIAAAAIFSPICKKVYDVHFEKSDHRFEGAPQFMVKAEAEAILAFGAEYMNREQDVGDENLRHAKRSLDPIRMYERQRAFPKL